MSTEPGFPSTGPGPWKAPRSVVWATAAFALLLLVFIAVLDVGLAPSYVARLAAVPGGDWTLHVVLVGLMALLMNVSFGGRRIQWGPFLVLRGSALVALVSTAEEFSQLLFARRAFSLEDLAYNCLGIALFGQLGAALAWWLQGRSAARRAP